MNTLALNFQNCYEVVDLTLTVGKYLDSFSGIELFADRTGKQCTNLKYLKIEYSLMFGALSLRAIRLIDERKITIHWPPICHYVFGYISIWTHFFKNMYDTGNTISTTRNVPIVLYFDVLVCLMKQYLLFSHSVYRNQ